MEEETRDFFKQFIHKLTFKEHIHDNFIIYKNADRLDLGYIIHYQKKGYYDVIIGDYSIASDFKLAYDHNDVFLRFGNVYTGSTKFKTPDKETRSFTPSAFMVVKEGAKGVQHWNENQHFHGIEITIYESYFTEVLKPMYGDTCISLKDIPYDVTQKYLPMELLKVIHEIESYSTTRMLNPMLLDSKMLQCMSIITAEYKYSSSAILTNQLYRERIKIGNQRMISLTMQDVELIKKAHEFITENACSHLTITDISNMLYIHEQKLKAGFFHMYHMTMWEYANSIRMTMATKLLTTTDLSIQEITKQVGYASIGSFSNMFKKKYHISPNQFRKENMFHQINVDN